MRVQEIKETRELIMKHRKKVGWKIEGGLRGVKEELRIRRK